MNAPEMERLMSIRRSGGVQIESSSLSDAWIQALGVIASPGVTCIEPLAVTITGFDDDSRPIEAAGVSDLIDAVLMRKFRATQKTRSRVGRGMRTVGTTASTIFPEALWRRERPRTELYERYHRILPRLKRHGLNTRGLYFERLIAFGRGRQGGNQLEHLFDLHASGVRRTSAYQMVIADPERDMTKEPRQSFPCLQQIAVHVSTTTNEIAITGFYGTQYLIGRAYGNYVGLCRLGRFIAIEMGFRLSRMTCIASYAPIDDQFGKSEMSKLLLDAQRIAGTAQLRKAM